MEGSYSRRNSRDSRKRPHQQFDNGKRKRHNSGHDSGVTSKDIDTIYRVLCPVKKIGSVLGKGGDIVNALRDETHAKIRVADAVPGAEERVIIIYSYLSQRFEDIKCAKDLDDKASEEMQLHCPAQDALIKVHDRIAADEILHGSTVETKETTGVVTARLLVPKPQVGCLLGKGGTVIQKIRNDTAASIRLLPSDHLPPCAMETDELVQISGAPSVVRKALYRISTLLHQHPRKENPPLEDIIDASTHGIRRSVSSMPLMHEVSPMLHYQSSDIHAQSRPWYGGYRDETYGYDPSDFRRSRDVKNDEPVEEFSIRILCPRGKIGGVIGKNGINVRRLEQQTGARIQVEDSSFEAEERVIIISAMEVPHDPISPTIEALLQLQNKTSSATENDIITTRLLIPSSKVGCIIGQGGNVITEMRRRTRADIRVFSKDDKPKYTSANEELVQISGNHGIATDALAEIASRLRDRTLRDAGSVANPTSAAFLGFPPESLSRQGVSSSENAYGNPASTHRFHGFTSPENFSGRRIPSSSMIEMGYDRPKSVGQSYETRSYRASPNALGYSNFSSLEHNFSSDAATSAYGSGMKNIANIRQMPGARSFEHIVDRYDSAQTEALHSYPQGTYDSSGHIRPFSYGTRRY